MPSTDRTSASDSSSGTTQLADGVGMDPGDRVDVGAVAAAHARRDRNSLAAFDHETIPRTQPLDRQLQTSETIPFVRIRACQVEHEIRPLASKRLVYASRQLPEILVVSRAVGRA